MDDEHKQLSAPPRARYNLYKILTLTVLFLALFFTIGIFGLKATSNASFCASCHEMKPEVYTWKASTHSEVDCVSCHIEPGAKQIAKDKAGLIVKALKKDESENVAPIRMPKEIPDSACEKCHNVFTREFTVSGDIIIPHDKHKEEDVTCIQCHNGVAHGEIADREMTFKTDYKKWDSELGITAMADLNFTRPDMDTCIDCHKSRQITIECSACHTTGMVPESHTKEAFKTKTHGKEAEEDLDSCNQCHKDMSTKTLKGYEKASTVTKLLNLDKEQEQNKNHLNYAKENTFCQDCHNKRPESHTSDFMSDHGNLASKNQETCSTCHELRKTDNSDGNSVYCASCHMGSHKKDWQKGHPVQVSENQKPVESCYNCHIKKTCTSCHQKQE
jgi:nitrate/TMAO reductase-like tetraheme cytochrome c subunit